MLSTWLSYSRSQFDPVCAAEIMHGLQHVPKLLFYTVECSTVSMITTTWLKICVESFAQTICRFHTGLLTLVNLTQSVMIILVVKVKNDHTCRLRQYKYWTNNQIVLRLKRSLTNRFQILTLFFEWFCHSTIINCFCDIFQILTSNRLLFRKVHNSSFQTEVLIGERFLNDLFQTWPLLHGNEARMLFSRFVLVSNCLLTYRPFSAVKRGESKWTNPNPYIPNSNLKKYKPKYSIKNTNLNA